VFNWLFAHHHRGKFILRVEDTDLERSRPEYTENIQAGLQWLGLNWDEGPFFQTQRLNYYRQAIQTLLDRGLAYRCYCTPEELEKMREEQKARNLAPRYDNRHRYLTPEQQAQFEQGGRKAVIRFIIDDDREIIWQDLIREKVIWKGSDLGGDMVIARTCENAEENFGQPLYNLAVVVDDIDMEITHVIRGEDHIANTAKQILLYEALGAKVPEFAHTPLILNQEGRKLSKRDGVTSIDDFRKLGFLPQALVNYMTLLGWTPPDSTEEIFTLDNEPHAYNADFLLNLPKTSFLSGKEIIAKRLGREYRYEGIQDNRSFLLKQPKPPKFAITKSAARYLKKRLRISPLRPSEKKFFQMIGALAHIKNETLNRKKIYAA
jgi:glutamyl-tRNA synthetase